VGKTAVTTTSSITDLMKSPLVRRAFDVIATLADAITEEHITICEIPAPPFGEARRAEYFQRRFRELGLTDVRIDEVGNVIGMRKGVSTRPTVVVSAHLDTVFPEEKIIRVRRDNGKLYAPGISDNASGLAALSALIQTLNRAAIPTAGTLVFLCTVGEEGEGNLRGVRHFFQSHSWRQRTDAFISLDGHGVERIVSQALGSRRYRVTVKGPGGHSWGDFGIVNPIHALATAITHLIEYPLPQHPRTSLNIGRVGGGQSVNAIPQSAWMDVDIRSSSMEEIDLLQSYLRATVDKAVREENARGGTSAGHLKVDINLLGERPSGQMPLDSDILRIAIDASKALGVESQCECASTDANIPISLGIPTITIGAGGNAGNPHTLDEWYDATNRELGIKRALLIMLALVGVREV
jgi:acetylornithine deacetylase/succinyl-diaminopimelate desuccinylase-like protein